MHAHCMHVVNDVSDVLELHVVTIKKTYGTETVHAVGDF